MQYNSTECCCVNEAVNQFSSMSYCVSPISSTQTVLCPLTLWVQCISVFSLRKFLVFCCVGQLNAIVLPLFILDYWASVIKASLSLSLDSSHVLARHSRTNCTSLPQKQAGWRIGFLLDLTLYRMKKTTKKSRRPGLAPTKPGNYYCAVQMYFSTYHYSSYFFYI